MGKAGSVSHEIYSLGQESSQWNTLLTKTRLDKIYKSSVFRLQTRGRATLWAHNDPSSLSRRFLTVEQRTGVTAEHRGPPELRRQRSEFDAADMCKTWTNDEGIVGREGQKHMEIPCES